MNQAPIFTHLAIAYQSARTPGLEEVGWDVVTCGEVCVVPVVPVALELLPVPVPPGAVFELVAVPPVVLPSEAISPPLEDGWVVSKLAVPEADVSVGVGIC